MGHQCCVCGKDLRYQGDEIWGCEGCRRTFWKPDKPLSEIINEMDLLGTSYWRMRDV